jgi:hypothetical protein
MSDITEFLARHPVRKGKLVPWQDDIIALRSAGATYRSICVYLTEHGVTVRPEEVQRFLHRCGRLRQPGPQKNPAPTPRKPAPPATEPDPHLPTFEWSRAKPKSSW